MRFATPISTLFQIETDAEQIIRESDCLELRDHSPRRVWGAEELLHTDVQPIHPICDSEWKHLELISQMYRGLRLVTMHVAACCDRPILSRGRFEIGGRVFSRKEMLQYARINIERVRQIFGPSVMIGIENNNYYPTAAYDIVCDPDFLSQLVVENSVRFLFDLAHARISAINKRIPENDYIAALPLDAIIQVHLCRHRLIGSNSAVDAHDLPTDAEFSELEKLVLNTNLEYVTFEYYREPAGLIHCLRRAAQLRNELTSKPI
jgi:uncharacterized protein (UPF0276 family)